jgi:hypothetical protein
MVHRSRPRRSIAKACWPAPLLALAGCAFSFPLPPAPTEAEREQIEATHFHATVGIVATEEYAWEAVALLESLRQTGLFDRVEPVQRLENPDLIARVRGAADYARPSTVSAGTTMITLGAFPTVAADEWGNIFSFHPARAPSAGGGEAATPDASAGAEASAEGAAVQELPIDFRVRGAMHIGWLAIFTGAFSDRTWAPPPMNHRYTEALAATICRHAPQIEAMIAESRRHAPGK